MEEGRSGMQQEDEMEETGQQREVVDIKGTANAEAASTTVTAPRNRGGFEGADGGCGRGMMDEW